MPSKSFHVEIVRDCWDGGQSFVWKGRGGKVGWGCFLKAVFHWKSTEIHWSEGDEVLTIYVSWQSGIFLTCYSKCIYIPNHNTFNQQLTRIVSKYFICYHSYRKKPQLQKAQHPKQSTFRALLPLFAVVETCTTAESAIISLMKHWPLKQTPENNLTACGFTEMNQWDMKEKARDLH